jgi:predicted phosphoribosyltransferase/pimeloyl-ACP methyl ester carboxylesterase
MEVHMAAREHSVVDVEEVTVGPHHLPGLLAVPLGARGLVLFAHGSGSSRLSSRNQYVAGLLQEAGIATLLFDLLTEPESQDRRNVFDIDLLAQRLQEAADWTRERPELVNLKLGYFGASTGAAAALIAAARRPADVGAVVSRGGRPDLAMQHLASVKAPTLLIVGGDDEPVIMMNREAHAALECEKELQIIPGATHLFPEPGALEQVAQLAQQWFSRYLAAVSPRQRAVALLEPQPILDSDPLFHDREDAARQLAERLKQLNLRDPLVLGIPRGGIVTGATLARELGAELDVTLSRKLRAPYQPELAIGAVGEDGFVYLNHYTAQVPGIAAGYVERERQYQLAEIARRQQLFRSARPAAKVEGRTVIVTDDGIATGSTMIAALRVVKNQQPLELIAAVPVAPPDRLDLIRQHCDRLICLYAPQSFYAVGQFYEAFEQVEDEEVVRLLKEFAPVTPQVQ